MSDIKEFITDKGTIIKGKTPNIDPKVSAKHTTDRSIKMTTQPFMFGSYRRYYLSEKELTHNKVADDMSNNPKKFYEYLKELGEQDSFEDYFQKESTIKEHIKDIAKNKAIDIIEDILQKRSKGSDIITKQELPTIEEIEEKEDLLLGNLNKIAEYIKNEMNDGEKKVILDHFKSRIY